MKQLPFLSTSPSWSPAGLNPRRPAIIVPVQGAEAHDLHLNATRIAATGVVDIIEWRIDPVLARTSAAEVGDAQTPDSSVAEVILELAPNVLSAGLPVLVTLRTGFEGGAARMSEDAYQAVLGKIVAGLTAVSTVPIAVDVEIDRKASETLIAAAHSHEIKVVASHHNFDSTDSRETLAARFDLMAAAGADVAKIAMMPETTHDVTAVLDALAEADARLACPVLGISMGELGRASRILGADFGGCATFAQFGLASAPGQIDARELASILDSLYG